MTPAHVEAALKSKNNSPDGDDEEADQESTQGPAGGSASGTVEKQGSAMSTSSAGEGPKVAIAVRQLTTKKDIIVKKVLYEVLKYGQNVFLPLSENMPKIQTELKLGSHSYTFAKVLI